MAVQAAFQQLLALAFSGWIERTGERPSRALKQKNRQKHSQSARASFVNLESAEETELSANPDDWRLSIEQAPLTAL